MEWEGQNWEGLNSKREKLIHHSLFTQINQITMIQTMNSCSRTSPTLIRYLSRGQVSSAHCQSPWVSLAPLSMDTLSSSRRAALLPWNSAASREQHSQQRLLQLYQRRRGGVQPPRLWITRAAGCPTRGTHPSMTTSPRMTCRMPWLSLQWPSRPLLLLCLSSKETLQHQWNSLLILLLQIRTVTQKNRHLCQRRKTNTVSKFLCLGFTFALQLSCFWSSLSNGDRGDALMWVWVSKAVSQCQTHGREMSVLRWAGSDSWGQGWSRPKGSGITQHLHYCSETMLLLCLPECESLRHSALQIYSPFWSPFPPPFPSFGSHCREELGPLQELGERTAFVSKTQPCQSSYLAIGAQSPT